MLCRLAANQVDPNKYLLIKLGSNQLKFEEGLCIALFKFKLLKDIQMGKHIIRFRWNLGDYWNGNRNKDRKRFRLKIWKKRLIIQKNNIKIQQIFLIIEISNIY